MPYLWSSSGNHGAHSVGLFGCQRCMYGRKIEKSSIYTEKFIYIVEELQHKLDDEEFETLAVVG
jgi:flagellin-specific chaperone FliS